MENKTVVFGITGGIAAYKAAGIVSALRKKGHSVFCIMTKNAAEFVRPLVFETLSNNPVAVDMFDREQPWEVEHISLAKRADLFVVAPATANFIGKYANGIADDMLSTTVMATKAPVLIAPAMNTNMYESAAVQENIKKLEARGVRFVGPGTGRLAEGTSGIGRLEEEGIILSAIEDMLFDKKDLKGLHVLVTAGPTRENIDPVRYISNRSSGKMGYSIAEAAARRGADVTLISGPVSLPAPYGVKKIDVNTTLEMYDAANKAFPSADITVKAAAPADFRAKEEASQKIKKEDGQDDMTLPLVKNPDIAASLGRVKKPGQVLVVFAAETENGIENAKHKLSAKNADMAVLNNVTEKGAGFDTDTNIVTFLTAEGIRKLPIMRKEDVAHLILDEAAAMLPGRSGNDA